jgi:hypothetical protein
MMKRIAILAALTACVVICGCAGSAVKYDQLRDETTSSQSIPLGPVLGHDPGNHRNDLYVVLTGKGRHPTEWRAYLSLTVQDIPKSKPLLLGETVKVDLGSYRELTTWTMQRDGFQPNTRTETFSLTGASEPNRDGLTIDDLIRIAEQGEFTVNGQKITLDKSQREQVKKVILDARETTNSGK